METLRAWAEGRAGAGEARVLLLLAATLACLLALPLPAADARPDPNPFRANDPGGFWNIAPPGQHGGVNAAQAAAFLSSGERPPHQYDQHDMYANLVYASPGLTRGSLEDYFKDASFGARPGDVQREYGPSCAVISPPSANSEHCGDVTIVRDHFGVPHVYGANRAALMFGLGYITGEDRLFLADALRHAGRAQLSSFVGGSDGNRSQDQETFAKAPYMGDHELRLQFDRADDLYGEDGAQVQADVRNYVDGMNQYIAESRLDPVNGFDALYAAINRPEGPDPWDVTDVIATGSLVAGIFGVGGGGEVNAATSLQQARRVLGPRRGARTWRDFRSANDPEAPTTVHRERFPYRVPSGRRGIAMPDPGSVEPVPVVAGEQGGGEQQAAGDGDGILGGILEALGEKGGGSNALLVAARNARGGRPLAVFGPQTGYFAPQLLMEQYAHAPGGPEGPPIDARGVSFVGTNLYVQLGRGRDYAWSATSAGQDITDTFAVRLCEPDGSEPTKQSMHYIWAGECLPIERIERTNSWTPNAADQTPPGSETLEAFRTKVGLVTHRATINGRPFAYTSLRATYWHEVDAAASFADWNSPAKIRGPRDFMRSAFKNDLTFNWFYIDDRRIAYINSGANPVRAPRTHPNFPVLAQPRFMWRDFDPDLATFRRKPLRQRPQVIDQGYMADWNNKQARGYRRDGIRSFTSIYRNNPLHARIREGIRGNRRMNLLQLIDAAQDAATVDLRGDRVVPLALRVITSKPIQNPHLRRAVRTLRQWARSGAHRRDLNDDGTYDHAEAVRIMDAWWPRWVRAQFRPTLGEQLYERFIGSGGAIHDAPGAIGSAFQNVVYGFVHKDLRSALGRPVRGAYSRVYCGIGRIARCRQRLRRTLLQAARTSFEELYGNEGCTLNNETEASPQMCHDAINPSDVTVASIGPFHWVNRPTFQQAVQVRGPRP